MYNNKKQDEKKKAFRVRIYRYTIQLIKFLAKLPNDPVIREIKSQLTRSGTSIAANYFESEPASSKKDFQNFFSHALKSANESCFWLALLRDADLISGNLRDECNGLLKETKELANIFAASIITMKSKR